ncbi:MAG: hypothetical protein Q4G50_06050 [Corynebacterium sp.]|uniref:LGFP repeat-containing protein n=1 Tax=Corynebacterium sp. TaxID=1720 RepID=UPI0026E0AB28|nr:hypothetical protein [Corynebacterium sp.]MDO5669547.1 hypothetical protein [Corynebacterium sp.]
MPFELEMGIEQSDYVSDRNEPSVEDKLIQYELDHPEVVAEYEQQVVIAADKNAALPAPKSTLVTGEMRSDVLGLPEGVSKEQADQVEIEEAQRAEQPRTFATTGCETMWPTGRQVCGAILDAYRQVGGQLSWLGPPKSNELTNPDGIGKRSEFYGGSIYWHPDIGAHTVTLDGMRQWGTLGWESGPLGYPTSGPIDINIPLSQMQTFQGGDNNYNPLTGGAVWGDIKQRYDQLGGSHHAIGIPITNEKSNGDQYFYNNFSNGTISWRNDRQTRFMYLATQKVWDALGRETGQLGFPESDETAEIPGVFHLVPFEDRGAIAWSGPFGAREMTGQLYNYWHSLYETEDDLGFPIPDVLSAAESTAQEFSNAIAFGSGDNIGLIRRDTPLLSLEDLSSSTALTLVADDSPQMTTLADDQASRSGIIVGGAVGGILRKLAWPAGSEEVRYVVRNGFYTKYANGSDDGWGYEKLTKKHNMSNRDMIYHLIKTQRENNVGGTETNNFKYTSRVYFVDCREYMFEPRAGCRNVEDPIYLTAIFRPVSMNKYKNYPAKDPTKSRDNFPVGVVTAWCHHSKSDERTEPRASRCPDYVNLWNKLRY